MNDHNTNANFYFLRGKEGLHKGNFQTCIRDLIYAKEMFTTLGNKEGSAESSVLLGSAYQNIDKLDQAQQMFSLAHSRYIELNKIEKTAECSLALGEIYREQGDFSISNSNSI